MKRMMVVGVLILVALPILARGHAARVRELSTQQATDIHNPMGQTAGWMLPTFAPISDLKAAVTLFVRTDVPWSDPSFVAQHRVSSGFIQVGVYRLRGSRVCMTQVMQVPAKPGFMDQEYVDMASYRDGDAIMFESWPGYNVTLAVWSVSDPTKFFNRAVVQGTDSVFRTQGVTLGDCN